MSQRRKRATIREVAKATGLSPAAVSYALRGMQTSEETQERVRKAADELGYEAHPIARALASGRTGMVGLLCGSLEDLWQQALAVGIGRALLARDRYAIILDAAGEPDRELVLARQLRDQRVDGLIVQPLDPAAELWTHLAQTLPVVSIGDSLSGGHAYGEVVFDNRRGVTLALEHLHGLGHRRIAVLTPTRPSTPDRPAEVYVYAEARRLAIDVTVVSTSQALGEATRVARGVLSSAAPPTALFCFSDSIAYGAYAATRELGMAVPGDVSIAGYDDHPMSALVTPPLTTVDWDIEGIVQAAVRVVIEAIDGTEGSGGVGGVDGGAGGVDGGVGGLDGGVGGMERVDGRTRRARAVPAGRAIPGGRAVPAARASRAPQAVRVVREPQLRRRQSTGRPPP